MRNSNRWFVLLAAVIILTLIAGGLLVGLYTDALWFSHAGYASVFWTRFTTQLSTRLVAGIVAGLLVLANLWNVTRQLGPVQVRRRYGNLEIAEQIPRRLVVGGVLLASVLAGWWLSDVKFGRGAALSVLTWLKRTPWGVADPLFNKDISFYVFSLPFYNQVVDLLLMITLWSIVLTVMGYALVGSVRWGGNRLEIDANARRHGALLLAALLVLLGVRLWLGRYGVLFTGTGFNNSIGYTDVHARLPAQRILALVCIFTGGALSYSALTQSWRPALAALAVLLVTAIAGGAAYPAFVQKFRVDPNEFRFEQPFIRWNIDFTRRAYALTDVQRVPYAYERLNAEPAELPARLEDVPVWDTEPLTTAYNQLQHVFPYYHFPDVDYDRYPTERGNKQVAIAVREFLATGLQENARTWLNLHFDPKYIRGVGAVITPAAVMGRGEPPTWLANFNPIERSADAPPQVNISDPSIFFGEKMNEFVVVRRSSGVTAPSTAIPLSNLLRVVAFSWRFTDMNLLFTGNLAEGSLVMHRSVNERLQTIAPFVLWDPDPYPVISNGRVVWMVDGYSATNMFPISRRMSVDGLGDVRYLRNTVKATVDAASGQTQLYRVDMQEPLLATYANAFPGLFQDISAMPEELRQHLKYPSLYLFEQSEMYGHYHLDNADAFYRAEDVWQVPPTGDATGGVSPFRAVYQMMTLPGEQADEFVLAVPYVARQRQNMTALMVARNDAPNYGRLVMLELPRNQLIPGPVQVHAIVEQEPVISQQLSLWRQAGSDVNIGHVRIVPIGTGFLYVMPLYLSAQGSPIPELQRIIVSDGARVAMGNSLRDAVTSLFGSAPMPSQQSSSDAGTAAAATELSGVPQRALELLDQAEQALRNGDYAGFGARMQELRRYLQQQNR